MPILPCIKVKGQLFSAYLLLLQVQLMECFKRQLQYPQAWSHMTVTSLTESDVFVSMSVCLQSDICRWSCTEDNLVLIDDQAGRKIIKMQL